MAVEQYRQLIQALLSERVQRSMQSPTPSPVEKQLIFDTERDRYQLVHVGWKRNGRRNYGCLLHLDIKDGKIWIQHDGTEEGIANLLVERGVPKQDIVLAFHAPLMWQYTDFGVPNV